MNDLAPFVRTLARGPGRSRNLTLGEAADAMCLVLSGEAEPEAVGALFMLMRYRGENADEIAGFVTAMRERLNNWSRLNVSLDWPTYASGRSRGLPYFVLSAALVAQAGVPVLMHGWTSLAQNTPRDAALHLGLPVVETLGAAEDALSRQSFAFISLDALDPKLFELLKLRDVLGLRSPINTCLRALNPSGAFASVQGVFHPSYRGLQQDAARLLGQPRLLCLKGGGGEFERHPAKDIAIFGLGDGVNSDLVAPAAHVEKRRLSSGPTETMDDLIALWTGEKFNSFEEAVVIGTAALALLAVEKAQTLDAATTLATDLWNARPSLACAA